MFLRIVYIFVLNYSLLIQILYSGFIIDLMFVFSSPHLCIEALTPKVMALRDRAFGVNSS